MEIKNVKNKGNFIGSAGGNVNIGTQNNEADKNNTTELIESESSTGALIAKVIGILLIIAIILFSIYFK